MDESLACEGGAVLVVEDDPLLRPLFVRVLTRAGFRVVSAANAREALDAAGRHRVDIILTDMQMPDMDGRRLIQRLRSIEVTAPVVILSGGGEPMSSRSAGENGVVRQLIKPVCNAELCAVVRQALATVCGDVA